MKPITYTAPGKTLRGLLFLFLLTFAAISPDTLLAGNQEDKLLQAIQVRNEQYMGAYLAGDITVLTMLHTGNATVIAVSYPMIPTASSIHTMRNAPRSTIPIANRYALLSVNRVISS